MIGRYKTHSSIAEEHAISLLAARMQGLSADDWEHLRELPVLHRFVGRGRSILDDGGHVASIRVLCKGWAIRVLELDDERRQILDFVLPGDVIGLHVDGAQVSTGHVIAHTPCELGEIELHELDRLVEENSGIAAGMRHHMTRELAQADMQIVRLGRMTAYERVCSFLLDIYLRQQNRARDNGGVDFPITQTVVSDALGLSVVHVNRQVMQLRREGLVSLNRKQLIVHDAERMAATCGHRTHRFENEGPSTREAAE